MPKGSACRIRGLCLAASLTLTAANTSAAVHIRLANEGSPGPLYECGAFECAPARTDDPSRTNLLWMDFYVLPASCQALASASLRPGGSAIDVECGEPGATTWFRCQAGSCQPLPSPGQPDANGRGIPLPSDCGGRIHELIVLNAGTATPTALVECDASSGSALEP